MKIYELTESIIYEIILFLGFNYQDIINLLSINSKLIYLRKKFLFLPFNEDMSDNLYFDELTQENIFKKYNFIKETDIFNSKEHLSIFPSGISLYPHQNLKRYISFYYYNKISNKIVNILDQIQIEINNLKIYYNKYIYLKLKKKLEILYIIMDFNLKFILCNTNSINNFNILKIKNFYNELKKIYDYNNKNIFLHSNNLTSQILLFMNNSEIFEINYFSMFDLRKKITLLNKISKISSNYYLLCKIIKEFYKLELICEEFTFDNFINYLITEYKNFYYVI